MYTDIMNFTLLGAGYFYVPINISEFCSGIQLSSLEAVWSFEILLSFLLGSQQCSEG